MFHNKMYQFFLNGGLVYTGEGHLSYYDEKEGFVHKRNGEKYTFQSLEALSCFVAFYGADVSAERKIATRFEWYVVTLDEVFGVFPRKEDAINFCVRLSFDQRLTRNITKYDTGVYQYSGPKKAPNQYNFIIGLRDRLVKGGFKKLIEAYEREQKLISMKKQLK